MSLNKYDLTAYRRAKRIRALKIDFLIVIFTLAAIILISREHPQPRPGAPAFHVQKQSIPDTQKSSTSAILATAVR
ncbi:hypothetical protein ABC383_03620 [Noviherbaspirillum sp. 1P10PC]|uniref:hypothetical protein n=1 Tax=Noviherbaspirillum sp. 1P10PC TaxID=3132292 RepID=UPI0039A114B6